MKKLYEVQVSSLGLENSVFLLCHNTIFLTRLVTKHLRYQCYMVPWFAIDPLPRVSKRSKKIELNSTIASNKAWVTVHLKYTRYYSCNRPFLLFRQLSHSFFVKLLYHRCYINFRMITGTAVYGKALIF